MHNPWRYHRDPIVSAIAHAEIGRFIGRFARRAGFSQSAGRHRPRPPHRALPIRSNHDRRLSKPRFGLAHAGFAHGAAPHRTPRPHFRGAVRAEDGHLNSGEARMCPRGKIPNVICMGPLNNGPHADALLAPAVTHIPTIEFSALSRVSRRNLTRPLRPTLRHNPSEARAKQLAATRAASSPSGRRRPPKTRSRFGALRSDGQMIERRLLGSAMRDRTLRGANLNSRCSLRAYRR